MTDPKHRVIRQRSKRVSTGQFVIDRAYVRAQAKEAVLTFIAPFTGVYRAVKGTSVAGTSVIMDRGKVARGMPKPYAKARAMHKKSRPLTTGRP